MNSIRLLTLLLTLFTCSALAPAQTKTAPKPAVAQQPAGDLVDVNHATPAELKALPGIGEAYSLAIVKHRPYKNKTQLKSMGVIPPAAYAKIKDKIIAKQ